MKYGNHEIKDTVYTEVSQRIETVRNSCEYTDLDADRLNYLIGKVKEKANELVNSKKREAGVVFKNIRIRMCRIDFSEYTEINLVWDESETETERKSRIAKEMERIDKDIARHEKAKVEKEEANNQKTTEEIKNAMKLLVENGYTVCKTPKDVEELQKL